MAKEKPVRHALLLTVLCCCPGVLAFGQGAIPGSGAGQLASSVVAPDFEVVSIKPSAPDVRWSNLSFRTGHFITENVSLRFVLQYVYELNSGSNDQIVGAPSWVGSVPFDIDAKEDEALVKRLEAMPAKERESMLRGMIERLLADRFQLKVHHETRVMPVDALVADKGGTKMKPTAAAGDGTAQSWSGLRHDGSGHIEGRGATTEMLASMLSTLPEVGGRLVQDTTGLTGAYDFVLQWTPEEVGAAGAESGPSLFRALQEQMGLKVEPRKAPVAVLVIDRVERPSAN